MFSNFVNSALGFLIIGGAGRKLAASTKTTNPALQLGAIAGGISALFYAVGATLIFTYLPAGPAPLHPLYPPAGGASPRPGGPFFHHCPLPGVGARVAARVVPGGALGAV